MPGVVEGLQQLRATGVRPGFVIIDDGWQDTVDAEEEEEAEAAEEAVGGSGGGDEDDEKVGEGGEFVCNLEGARRLLIELQAVHAFLTADETRELCRAPDGGPGGLVEQVGVIAVAFAKSAQV